ncbi:MAG: phosphate ABC transporter permease subunit PstC, partial [Methanoregula sp.]
MVFAVPLSLGCAIYISEIASPRVKSILKPATELLAGIPSVVYGFFGLIVLTTLIREVFNLPTGETWLAGSILLGIMALPTIISVSEDAISSVPHEFREGSLAVGATKWETISRVIVPAALSGIAAAIILGIGRAIGETMAVLMVTGNAAILPDPI